MHIFLADPKKKLTPRVVKSVIVEFSDGRKLKLAESASPMPKEIPEGISVRGIGKAAQSEYDGASSLLNITPVASNGIIVFPFHPYETIQSGHKLNMKVFISDENDLQQPVNERSIVIELKNGKSLEFLEDHARRGLLIWGGREPVPGLPPEDMVKRTESIGIYPKASNIIHVFPYKISPDVVS